MLTRMSQLAICLLLLAAIPACDSGASGKVDVVGKWVSGQAMIETTYEFRKDGTFTKSFKVASDLPAQSPIDGTWELDKDMKLHLKFGDIKEVRQIVINAGMPSFAGEGQQVFYKTH